MMLRLRNLLLIGSARRDCLWNLSGSFGFIIAIPSNLPAEVFRECGTLLLFDQSRQSGVLFVESLFNHLLVMIRVVDSKSGQSCNCITTPILLEVPFDVIETGSTWNAANKVSGTAVSN